MTCILARRVSSGESWPIGRGYASGEMAKYFVGAEMDACECVVVDVEQGVWVQTTDFRRQTNVRWVPCF